MTDVLIIEDEPPAARRLAHLVGRQLTDVTIRHAINLDVARVMLSETSADLVLLDLNLQGHDGFKFLEELSDKSTIIVVSANTDRALEAFDHGVTDFVAKPVSEHRLRTALDRGMQQERNKTPTLPMRSSRGIDLVPVGDIVSASALENYSEVRVSNGRVYMEDRSLTQLENKCSGHLVRIHRSHLINLEHVKDLHKDKVGVIVRLIDGTELPVSRRRMQAISSALGIR